MAFETIKYFWNNIVKRHKIIKIRKEQQEILNRVVDGEKSPEIQKRWMELLFEEKKICDPLVAARIEENDRRNKIIRGRKKCQV